jgi:hypothetical protein
MRCTLHPLTRRRKALRMTHKPAPLFWLALACLLVALVACGSPPSSAPNDDPVPTTDVTPTTTVADTTTTLALELELEVPAVVSEEAVRIEPPTTTAAPFDCATYVNGIAYQAHDPEPARLAYRTVAACRGWDQATVAKWERFVVDDVMRGESSYCWNVRGGALLTGNGCELAWQGNREDTGIMQLIGLWYRGGPLCVEEGMCSSNAILASPWASFNAGLFAVEHDGRGPWCYSDSARRLHWSCYTVPRYWP